MLDVWGERGWEPDLKDPADVPVRAFCPPQPCRNLRAGSERLPIWVWALIVVGAIFILMVIAVRIAR